MGAAAGALAGLALLKFGNPVIFDSLITAPTGVLEWVFQSWPLRWGYYVLVPVVGLGLAVGTWRAPRPWWPVLLPFLWLCWQVMVALDTVDAQLTGLTVPHFAATTVCFYVGLWALAPVRRMGWFWGLLLGAFVLVLWSAFEQRFGGLEAARRMVYAQPGWERLPPEHLKRLANNRVFGTLLYPNTLAGVLLLWVPALAVSAWRLAERLTFPTRLLIVIALVGCSGAVLYWSGSKAGWLIAMVMVAVTLLRTPMRRAAKVCVLVMALMGGTVTFGVRYADYFARGATSVGARLDYWRAGWRTLGENPWTGSGPGTFSITYRRIKPPEAEMARLAHNDYLEQGCDSGWPGLLLYVAFVVSSLVHLGLRSWIDPLRYSVWLGLAGWGLQSLVEFGLYIPAVAWSAFLMMGWLWGTSGSFRAIGERLSGRGMSDTAAY